MKLEEITTYLPCTYLSCITWLLLSSFPFLLLNPSRRHPVLSTCVPLRVPISPVNEKPPICRLSQLVLLHPIHHFAEQQPPAMTLPNPESAFMNFQFVPSIEVFAQLLKGELPIRIVCRNCDNFAACVRGAAIKVKPRPSAKSVHHRR